MSYSSNNDTPPTVSSDNHTIGLVTDPRGGPGSGGDVRKDPVYRVKAQLFRTLGHPARVLELLGDRERTVGELQDALERDSSGVSQHLSALRREGVLESRKSGTSVFCRVKDRRTLELLSLAREILVANLEESRLLLGELDAETAAGQPSQPARTATAAAQQVRGRGR